MYLFNLIATSCTGGSFFGLPKWYAYLPGAVDKYTNQCVPQFTNINDTWLVVAAIIEALLRIAAIVAVIMVVVGGVSYTTSQGKPETASRARSTIIFALVGLLISISAAILITFVASSIGA